MGGGGDRVGGACDATSGTSGAALGELPIGARNSRSYFQQPAHIRKPTSTITPRRTCHDRVRTNERYAGIAVSNMRRH